MKNIFYAYHVVTDRKMELGQHISFDDKNQSGVYKRVKEKENIVKDIFKNPENYDLNSLEHHTKVAIRELALEKVRKEKFPNYPSRLASLYVSEDLQDAKNWSNCFVDWGRPTYAIVKLKISGSKFVGDAYNCFNPTFDEQENLKLAERYWLNLPNIQNVTPIRETLVNGDIEVVEIVEEINKNLNFENENKKI